MDRYQYRITVNGTVGPILETYPQGLWEQLSILFEARGLSAQLERRFVTDASYFALLADPCGYLVFGDLVIGPWEGFAALEAAY